MDNFDLKKYLAEGRLLKEFNDLSISNNYLDKDNEVDSREVAKDLLKIKPYFKSRLPKYRNGKELSNMQIDSLIDSFTANERDISASDPTGPAEIERIQGKWKSVDIDNLTDYFISFVEGIAENWDEWEFYDPNEESYSNFNWNN